MTPFPFRNRLVQATFPVAYRLGYEKNGDIEAHPGPDAPIVFRFSLHPKNNQPRPTNSGGVFVTMKADALGRPLELAGETVFFYEGQDDSYRADGIAIRHWLAGFRSWMVGVSATIAADAVENANVTAAQIELETIFASLEEPPRQSLWSRWFGRWTGRQ